MFGNPLACAKEARKRCKEPIKSSILNQYYRGSTTMGIHDSSPRPPCPRCQSTQILKNGSTHHKKQKFLCKVCHYQFIENPTKKYIQSSDLERVKALLLERISLAGISRSLQVSSTWLQRFVNRFLSQVPCYFKDDETSGEGIILECDELWSFVANKENQVWCWIALDRKTRRIVGLYMGDRSRDSAKKLWDSLPTSYRACQLCYTDFWEAYVQVIPEDVHQPSSKQSGQTSHIERLNNTLRQRCSRLVRKTLSFSKDRLNHENAIWYFAHHYNSLLGFS